MLSRSSLLGLALALVAAPAVALPASAASAKASPTTLAQVAKRLAAESGGQADPDLAKQLANIPAPGMTQAGPAPAITQSTSPLMCNGPQPSGVDPADGGTLDVTSWGQVCTPGVTGIKLSMTTAVDLSTVDDVELYYDTDDNASNGYFGADYVVEAFWEPSVRDLVAVVLRTPSADPNAARFVTLGGAYVPQSQRWELDVAWPSWAWTTIGGFGVMGTATSGAVTDTFGEGWVRAPAVSDPTPANPWGQSRFVPLANPTRLLDTRNGIGVPAGKRPPNSSIVVPVRGHAGIPDDPSVQAVVMNVTAVDATSPGYVQVLPTGVGGDYSNLNTDTAGQTIPNLAVVPIGADGSVTIYTQGGAHLLADVSGYFVASGATGGGRYVAAPSAVRVLDTRIGMGGFTRVPANGTVTVNPGFVGPDAASAVVMNVTSVNNNGWGFVTAYPTGQPLPDASNLNMVRQGQVIPNLVIVPIGPDGHVNLTTSVGTDLIADVLGYFTADSQPVSTSGLYVPVPPHRARDSRLGYPQAVKPFADDSVEVPVLGRGAVPVSGVSAVLLNLTATMAEGAGFVTAFPSEATPPNASNVNFDHTGQTIANSAIVRVGSSFVSLQASVGNAFLLADTFGYFTA